MGFPSTVSPCCSFTCSMKEVISWNLDVYSSTYGNKLVILFFHTITKWLSFSIMFFFFSYFFNIPGFEGHNWVYHPVCRPSRWDICFSSLLERREMVLWSTHGVRPWAKGIVVIISYCIIETCQVFMIPWTSIINVHVQLSSILDILNYLDISVFCLIIIDSNN